jgi:8-oxo-dGTP pyrophosphatase MutT (NUDIX family)
LSETDPISITGEGWAVTATATDKIVARLRQRLARAGAGLPTGGDWPDMGESPRRPAAVLVPLVLHEERADGPTVLLTRRTDHLHHHPGQVSFPGGGMEAGDASAEDAALRETTEEIGLARDRVEVIGRLPDYLTGTGFCVTPVIGLVRPPLVLELDSFEVAEVFEVPLAHFLDPANHQRHSITVEGRERYFHAMPYGGYFIWGATAGMLMSLYRVLV